MIAPEHHEIRAIPNNWKKTDSNRTKLSAAQSNIFAIGATHHLFIAINSALQKFRILRTMGGANCVFSAF